MDKENKFYLGSSSFNFDKEKEKLHQRVKNLLLLNNVNFLFGNGTSIPLGAPVISNIKSVIKTIEDNTIDKKDTTTSTFTRSNYFKKIKELNDFSEGLTTLKTITAKDDFNLDIESFLNTLIQSHNIASIESFESDKISIGGNQFEKGHIEAAITIIKAYLFYSCKTFLEKILGTTNKLRAHKEFLRRSLLRPVTLPRVKIFTTNYDLIFERCMDELSISYFTDLLAVNKKDLGLNHIIMTYIILVIQLKEK
jgi:hypothetical protein